MTLNELNQELSTLLLSHAMIKTAKNVRPQEWLNRGVNATFPAVFWWATGGSMNKGQKNDFTVTFWFLDKAGQEFKFEEDVVSDMQGIAYDIIQKMRVETQPWLIDDNINFDVVSDYAEDYLAGITMNFTIETFSTFTACDMPLQ